MIMDSDEIYAYCKRKGYSVQYAKYWAENIFCEASMPFKQPAEPPHHIRTRGAGGDDDPANLLSLSYFRHKEIHRFGPRRFAEKYPHLKLKIMEALNRPRCGHKEKVREV